jgi:DNA helicase IV
VPDHPDLEDEQEFLNRAHDGLESMRSEARQMLQGVLDLGKGGTFQSRTERDIVVRTSLARLEQLDIGDQALYFGRIDRFPDPPPEPDLPDADADADAADADGTGGTDADAVTPTPAPAGSSILGESFHIGRLAVSGPDHEPLVVDWRAPVAEPFYRATGLDPQGLARRRHLAVRGRTVLGLEDEYFVDPTRAPGAPVLPVSAAVSGDEDRSGERLLSEGMVLGGPGALLSALGQARTGHMGDIIGTIQREQDEIIRSPLSGVLVVQGGPGTGKTAVALHRAAYLLYTHRFPLERQGVLVVGPNPLFLRYIEQVLPSLGETGVSLSTVAGLVPEVRVRGTDGPAVAKLKGDVRMVKVLARAVRTRQRPLRHDVEVPFGAGVLRLRANTTEEIIALARRRPGTHNVRRRFVEAHVLRALSDDYRARLTRGSERLDDDGPSAEEQADLARRLRRTPQVAEALDRMWPRLARTSSAPRRYSACTGRAANPWTKFPGRWPTPPSSTRPAPSSGPGAAAPARTGAARAAPRRAAPRRWGSGRRAWRPHRCRRPVPWSGRRTTSAPSATSWSTRSRTCRPCSSACWPAGPCRAP